MPGSGKKLRALFVGACAVALCVALSACGGSASSSAASASASSAGSSAASASASSEAASASSASVGKNASSASASASSAAASSSAASQAASSSAASQGASTQASSDLVDEHGNITLYAIMESTGPDLVSLMEKQGYEWDSAKSVWLRNVDGASFAALKNSGPLSLSDYKAATSKGGTAVAVSSNVVAGYKNAEEALKGNKKCSTVDSFFDDTGSGIAIVYGPSMVEYLVIAQQKGESTVEIDIYSKEAVGSGMLDQVYGGQVGGSFQEVWKTFTGKDSYGH